MELLGLLSTEAVKSDNEDIIPLSDQKQQQMKLEACLGNTASWVPDHNRASIRIKCITRIFSFTVYIKVIFRLYSSLLSVQ